MEDKTDRNLSTKERMEMFQSGVSQLTSQNDVSSVRELLRQRYLKNRAEEDAKRKEREEMESKNVQEAGQSGRTIDTSKVGKQLARVFRFGKSANIRQRHTAAQQNRANARPQIDPFDDPNVLLENFGFENDPHEDNQGQLLFDNGVDVEFEDDEDIDDDSFRSLVRLYLSHLSWARLFWIFLKLAFYLTGQMWAYKNGFGAAFFAVALLVFICTNLRNKAPGELSAYSVFNPFCRSIPSTAGSDQPQDNIVLLGQL